MDKQQFDITGDTMVVTSKYVTHESMPILYVSHEKDEEEGGSLWQFHCGNDDYDMSKMQLVRLNTILRIDPTIIEVADLPFGFSAKRASQESEWIYQKEE